MGFLVSMYSYVFSSLICMSVADSKQLPQSKFIANQKHVDILIEIVLISNWLDGLVPANLE